VAWARFFTAPGRPNAAKTRHWQLDVDVDVDVDVQVDVYVNVKQDRILPEKFVSDRHPGN
jgi:hypothetical protein